MNPSQKLRRHGRTRNKNGPATSDQNETASKNRAGSEEVKKVEDPNETQVSTIAAASASTALLEVDADDQAKSPTSPLPFPGDEGLENFIQNMKNFRQSRQALYSVLDDYLSGKVWSPQVSWLVNSAHVGQVPFINCTLPIRRRWTLWTLR